MVVSYTAVCRRVNLPSRTSRQHILFDLERRLVQDSMAAALAVEHIFIYPPFFERPPEREAFCSCQTISYPGLYILLYPVPVRAEGRAMARVI